MQRVPFKVVICGRWKHCSKIIHRPGVCYSVVLSVVRKMSKAKVNVSVEQHIIIKFLMKEGCKPSEICSRLKRQYGEKTLSNVSVYKWSSEFKKGRETVKNELHVRRPRTSITGENSDRFNALIRENRRITLRELSGILNITDGSVKTIIKQHLQYSKGTLGTREKGSKHQCHFSRITPVHTWLLAAWTPSRNWNGTFYHILHVVRTLLPQTINSLAP